MKKSINTLVLGSLLTLGTVLLVPGLQSAPEYLSFQTEDEANNIEIFSAASRLSSSLPIPDWSAATLFRGMWKKYPAAPEPALCGTIMD